MIREDMTMETYRVLLFDIDNTLLDFTAGAMQSMEAIFLEAGLAYPGDVRRVPDGKRQALGAH